MPQQGLSPADQALGLIQTRWAEIKYQVAQKQQDDAYQALLADVDKLRAQYPDDLRLAVWQGIILSTQAGARGGLGALSLCKQARTVFEQAIAADAAVLEGSAYTSLGSLYYQVPGWPIGFGDDDKAKELLLKGLAINPNGIDANFFYADFLFDQGDYQGAAAALQKVLSAPSRPGRDLADQGRREEAEVLLAKVKRKLS
ncbi:hypothetical protein IFO71_12745 [Pseudoxanthomonas sp. CAU 1598]|uniref:Tetratricopeptide repeat protein n=2 Tax=Pseudomarimonas arenosa TaxID=2774145 RepID=A0AAW3ZKI8_9GAMM|nr:hypothetical protein [Pseudomarimonas arenosa]